MHSTGAHSFAEVAIAASAVFAFELLVGFVYGCDTSIDCLRYDCRHLLLTHHLE
jgi:hypothetical protein